MEKYDLICSLAALAVTVIPLIAYIAMLIQYLSRCRNMQTAESTMTHVEWYGTITRLPFSLINVKYINRADHERVGEIWFSRRMRFVAGRTVTIAYGNGKKVYAKGAYTVFSLLLRIVIFSLLTAGAAVLLTM